MNYLEIIGTLIGLLYLYLEYRASIYLWVAGIIMPAIYLFVYYDAGLYADVAINVYYLGAAVYGWVIWKSGKQSTQQELPITHAPIRTVLPLTVVFLLCFFAGGWMLEHWTDSTVPWWDSFTTALSIIGMWMLARKYVEQWIIWIGVDIVCCALYLYKDLYFTGALYGLYAVIAIFGFYKWKKMMNNETSTVL